MVTQISVLMSVYAGERTDCLRSALQSLSDQTLKADEIVLVQDGPISVELQDIITEYQKLLPIQSVRLKENVGLAAALNEGLKLCSHALVARMDTDDIALPERFDRQVQFLKENDDIHVVGTWAVDVDETGNLLRERRVPVEHKDIYRLIWTCPFIHPTVMFRRDAILGLGGYSIDTPRAEDYELWFRAAKAGLRFSNIPVPLLKYTVRKRPNWMQSLKQGWFRAVVGWKGCAWLRLPMIAYVGVGAFLIRGLLPLSLQRYWIKIAARVDPRAKALV